MGPATLAVTEVSHVTVEAEEGVPEASKPAAAEARGSISHASDCCGSKADDELDALQDLGDQIATLAAHIHAAEHRFLTLIAEFDRLRGWERGGHRSCAHWLAFRTGIDLGAARERVRAARALNHLPQISASMEQGELSFAKVRALTRVATPESEGDLLELALSSTAAQLERTVRAWRRLSRWDEGEIERMRHRSRCFSVFPDEDGMYVVRGRLDPEVGAMLMRAIDAAGDALFRKDTSEDTSQEIEPKQRRADALGLGSIDADHAESADVSGTRAERYQVVLHVEAPTLESESEPGRSELEDGTRVSAETSRRLSCDASMVRLTEAPDGSVLDVGRKTRTIPPALVLPVRQTGARVPRSWMPLPGLWTPLHRRPSREALGRRRRDKARATFPCTSMIRCAFLSSSSSRALRRSNLRTFSSSGLRSGLRPRFFDSAVSDPFRAALRHVARLDTPSRRRMRPTSPGSVHRPTEERQSSISFCYAVSITD